MESLISGIFQIVADKLLEEGNLLLGVREEAKKMLKYLERIKIVMASAEKKEFMEDKALKLWIRELKEVTYDIEDVLEDWTNLQLQTQGGESGTSQRGNKPPKEKDQVCFSCIPTPCFCFKQVKGRHEIAHTIVEINEKLDGIADRKKNFNFEKNVEKNYGIAEHEPTITPFAFIHNVPSQEKAKSTLIQQLVSDDFKNFVVSRNDYIPIVSAVGLGGIGKTTLARMVYKDQIVIKHFPKIIWVCVSDNFNALKIANTIAAEVPSVKVENPNDLTHVLTKIADSIEGVTFLLVLDDVWESSLRKLDPILSCMGNGDAQKSRILLTTRSSDLADKMKASFKLDVGVLSEDDSLSLFCYYAFSERTKEDYRRVEVIAKELVKKCDGLPLALEVLGRHMVTKTSISEWDNVLHSKMWEKDFQDNVFRSLSLSYLELESEAKRCFAFCSVFPKDTVMKKNKLIRLWVAQGYLQKGQAGQMEALGEECFKSLLCRSFFQVATTSNSDELDVNVTMHDIVHDFALFISSGEAASLDSSLQLAECGGNSMKLRHLALHEIKSNRPYSSLGLKALRSLFLSNYPKNFLKDFSSIKSHIRVLDIYLGYHSKDIGDGDLESIEKLVHLRFLRLGSSFLTMLPEEICSLPFLQTLDVEACYKLKSLPKNIGRLTCLRHLLSSDDSMNTLPKGLGKLCSLQTLKYFPCSSRDRKDYSSLEDLGDLNNLRGHLRLKNLNQVANAGEAIAAQLHMKKHIQKLTLKFGEGDPSLQSDVLESLEPAKGNYIELLEIEGHRGRTCPWWIGELRNLKEVLLENVSMEVLPAGLGMLRHLEILRVTGANGVKRVGVEFYGISEPDIGFFPKLTNLEFEDMSQWEQWEAPKEIGTIMPRLRHLKVEWCEELRTLPRFIEHIRLESLIVDSPHLPQVIEPVEDDDRPGKFQWRMGDFLLPHTLKEIRTMSTELVQKEASGRHAEMTMEVVQQQHDINFDLLRITMMPRVPGWLMDFNCFKHIELSDFEDECLPPLGLMRSLQELTISFADKVEKVGDEFLGTSNINNNNRDGEGTSATITVFPRLKKLTFEGMEEWQEWEDPMYRNSNTHLVIMPSLCGLTIDKCDRLRSLPQFFKSIPLKKLYVGNFEKIDMLKIRNTIKDEPTCKMIKARSSTIHAEPDFREIELHYVRNEWLCDWSTQYCNRLTRLTLWHCNEESIAGLEALPSLEELELLWGRDGDGFRRMATEVLQISSLKKLQLKYMESLEEWEDPSLQLEDESRQHDISNSSIRSNLRILELWSCPRLKALPSSLKSIPLRELSIRDCAALETWWANEAGQDWRNWTSNIPKFTFKGGDLFGEWYTVS